MKKYILFTVLLVGIAISINNVFSDGWDTTGSVGDVTQSAINDTASAIRGDKLDKSALGDSLQLNDHPAIKADTLHYKVANNINGTYFDLYNDLVVDSLAANGDSIKVWYRPKLTTAEKDTSWRLLLQGYGSAGDDSLLLGNIGYSPVDNPDSMKIWLASSDTTNGRIDVSVTNSNGDLVFYKYDVVLTGLATMTEYAIPLAGAGTETFDANERYCVMIRVYIDTGDWAIIGKARCW